ncbi:hypothetical protein [Brachybacterium epidermidis]|uniref:hypothetical protein n=1 Tax=Brachybacterium epidermidis TaxID=2781983 RepID=UPI00398E8CBE
MSQDRLRRADLYQMRRGLYAHQGRAVTELDVVTAVCRNTPEAVVVGLSAARLLGMPLPLQDATWHSGRQTHLAIPGVNRSSDRVVRWHMFTFRPEEVGRVIGKHRASSGEPAIPDSAFRMSTRARTWRDLAPHLTHLQLVSIGDHLVRRPRPTIEQGRQNPWCTLDELGSVCTGRYATKLRTALADVRVGSDSPRETMLRLAFRDAGLPEPLINEPLYGPRGEELHRPDFQWPDYRLCAEYEGKGHNDGEQVRRDIRRARRARSAGFHEIRLSNDDVQTSGANAVQIVRSELLAHGWRP